MHICVHVELLTVLQYSKEAQRAENCEEEDENSLGEIDPHIRLASALIFNSLLFTAIHIGFFFSPQTFLVLLF